MSDPLFMQLWQIVGVGEIASSGIQVARPQFPIIPIIPIIMRCGSYYAVISHP